MVRLGIYCPTYKRPHTLQKLVDNIVATTSGEFKLYFGVEQDDKESLEAAKATGHSVVVNKYDPQFGYSNTIQSIYEEADEPIFIHANDDFVFLPDWDKAPRAMFDSPMIQVIGVKQTKDDQHCSAIHFIRRSYIENFSGVVDMPNRVFYPYHHNYQDTEMTQTAQARGVWAKCTVLGIEHQHPGFMGKDKDETYRKNDSTVGEDVRTFASREHLWKNIDKLSEEDIMAKKTTRNKMSAEARAAVSERMKARWAEKKGMSQNVRTEETTVPTFQKDSLDPILKHTLQKLYILEEQNPDMIEIKQAKDLIGDLLAKLDQVKGLLNSQ